MWIREDHFELSFPEQKILPDFPAKVPFNKAVALWQSTEEGLRKEFAVLWANVDAACAEADMRTILADAGESWSAGNIWRLAQMAVDLSMIVKGPDLP